MQFVPTKLYYKIREVSKIVGVETHVLRFWESEFPCLVPPKSNSGHRTYRPKDIELLLQIRRLLYDEGYTIAGARKQLISGRQVPAQLPPFTIPRKSAGSRPAKQSKPAGELSRVREELENILTLLNHE